MRWEAGKGGVTVTVSAPEADKLPQKIRLDTEVRRSRYAIQVHVFAWPFQEISHFQAKFLPFQHYLLYLYCCKSITAQYAPIRDQMQDTVSTNQLSNSGCNTSVTTSFRPTAVSHHYFDRIYNHDFTRAMMRHNSFHCHLHRQRTPWKRSSLMLARPKGISMERTYGPKVQGFVRGRWENFI